MNIVPTTSTKHVLYMLCSAEIQDLRSNEKLNRFIKVDDVFDAAPYKSLGSLLLFLYCILALRVVSALDRYAQIGSSFLLTRALKPFFFSTLLGGLCLELSST